MRFSGLKYLIAGCGFWGAVLAERIATVLDEKVLIIDKKNHIGGASYSETDSQTGINVHKYGSHIFHTKSQKVWDYINRFSDFNDYKHRVLVKHKDKIYPFPINLKTINSFYNLNLSSSQAEEFIKNETLKSNIKDPKNFEEKAISLVGEKLYNSFIKNYSEKHWGIDPKFLPKELFSRIPLRINDDSNYFLNEFQGIPVKGYDNLFKNLLSDKNIELLLNTDYFEIKNEIPSSCKIIYSGEIDKFFNYKYGNLSWRSLHFESQILDVQNYQGTSVMNFSDIEIPYTRIHEFKHFMPEKTEIFNSKKTIIAFEYPKNYAINSEAFYPVNTEKDKEIYQKYLKEASQNQNLIVGGRLGLYRYLNMDKTVEDALSTFETILRKEN